MAIPCKTWNSFHDRRNRELRSLCLMLEFTLWPLLGTDTAASFGGSLQAYGATVVRYSS